MRYAAAEKLGIIRLVEQSSLSARRTLAQVGIPRSTFYRWYERYLERGAEARKMARRRRVWNKLPTAVTQAVLEVALKRAGAGGSWRSRSSTSSATLSRNLQSIGS